IRDVSALDGGRHETRRQLDLVATVGAQAPSESLEFAVLSPDRASVREILARRGLAPVSHYFVVHGGASAPSRRYP
ncbi:glycosyltransferase family 9 protein, partial [Salmonella enterica]|uniref:glycosyltransferase family 9 protein n=1 Tax=Salmonella enterica TaxID=28901 RepID=UPI0032973746